jgi:hypothetical protein
MVLDCLKRLRVLSAARGQEVEDDRRPLDPMIPIRYDFYMSIGSESRPVLLMEEEIKTPPFSHEARREVGQLLRLIQDGFPVGLPHSRPMPSIGPPLP